MLSVDSVKIKASHAFLLQKLGVLVQLNPCPLCLEFEESGIHHFECPQYFPS